jgi:hypothetical protein
MTPTIWSTGAWYGCRESNPKRLGFKPACVAVHHTRTNWSPLGVLTPYLPRERRISRPLDEGAFVEARLSVELSYAASKATIPPWATGREYGSGSGSRTLGYVVQSHAEESVLKPAMVPRGGIEPPSPAYKAGARPSCCPGWGDARVSISSEAGSQPAGFACSLAPPWSAARESHPDLRFCRPTPTLAGSRHRFGTPRRI